MNLLWNISWHTGSDLTNLLLQFFETIVVDRKLIELAPKILETLLQHVELIFQLADIQLAVIRFR